MIKHREPTASQEASSSSLRSANVFVSYRRKDTAGYTGSLVRDLNSRLRNPVFRDLESIPLGANFRTSIKEGLSSCRVLIAVIGHDWSTVTDKAGKRRLDDPSDVLRTELATALALPDVLVIPVLMPDASMPEDLPPDLAELADRNGIQLTDRHWAIGVEELLQRIENTVPGEVVPLPPAHPWRDRFRTLVIALVGGFPPSLLIATLLPHQMRGFIIPLSAVGVGLFAVVFEPYGGKRLVRSDVTRRLGYTWIAVIGLVSFVGLRMVLAETVPSGSHGLTVLTSFADRVPFPRCPCPESWDDRQCLVGHQSDTTFKRCWGSLLIERALLWAASLAFSAGFGGFIGLVGAQRHAPGRSLPPEEWKPLQP